MRTFVMGDIHGAHRALRQCLERAQFDVAADRLIALGDVCDGWPDVRACIDELLTVRHLDYIMGNHDIWTLDWAVKGTKEAVWLTQGGHNTVRSYGDKGMPDAHVAFLKKAVAYLEYDNKLFVHAGFKPGIPLAQQKSMDLAWDRSLIFDAASRHREDHAYRFAPYSEIYLGHTPTVVFHVAVPLQFCNVWAMDTGAGWSGKLTIMDIHTKEYWQSDFVPELYPGQQPRG